MKPKEECGVFGVFGTNDPARDVYFGLCSLQHRGQESAGIAVSNSNEIDLVRSMGLAHKVFTEDVLAPLKGDKAIGHVRYSTAGESKLINAQPFVTKGSDIEFAIAHNGNLVNFWELRDYWTERGHVFMTSTDTEIIAYLIGMYYHKEKDFFEAIKLASSHLDGSYSMLILTNDALYAVRDRYGFRPLSVCELNKGFAFSSEDCAFSGLEKGLVRDVKPGEIVKTDANGLSKERIGKMQRKAHCMFEYVYFSRPDSVINGVSVYQTRKKLGRFLAKDYPARADVVAAVPFSGVAAAVGYSEESGVPYAEVLIRNRYMGRTFIQPAHENRDFAVRTKLIPIRDEIQGREVVLVDDSIVRGTTMKQIVSLIKDAGAKAVHLRISCPPIIAPCFYGIDMQQYKQFIAVEKTVDEIRKFIGADSLAYNSMENLVRAIGLPKRSLCLACLNEEYPTELGHLRAHQMKLTGDAAYEGSRGSKLA
ncbi:MAG: amidophosphoribosyltransferase [Candidatus Altiarchaeota archaeon]|nr:amidophosphoribosyltransferase [Candidatus Altiarchaeota archaeon]